MGPWPRSESTASPPPQRCEGFFFGSRCEIASHLDHGWQANSSIRYRILLEGSGRRTLCSRIASWLQAGGREGEREGKWEGEGGKGGRRGGKWENDLRLPQQALGLHKSCESLWWRLLVISAFQTQSACTGLVRREIPCRRRPTTPLMYIQTYLQTYKQTGLRYPLLRG